MIYAIFVYKHPNHVLNRMKFRVLLLVVFASIQLKAQFSPTLTWTFGINSACFGGAAAADMDNDGKKEIVFATYANDGKVYCLNAEDGSLKWSYNIGGCGDVAVNIYDLNMDGQLDVFVNGSCNPTAFCINGNTGALTWSVASGGGDSPATIADIDADGKPEVVFGNFSGQVRILNGENGSLVKNIQVYTANLQTDPALTDVNNDGVLDILVANHNNSSSVYSVQCYNYTTSLPIWTNTVAVVSSMHSYHGGALADIDKDGKMEYVIGANNGLVRAFNVEDGSILWTVNNPGQQAFHAISIADVNKDDTLDVIYHRSGGLELLNGVNGKVQWTHTISIGGSFRGSVVTDLNGNGKLDLVSSHYMGTVRAVEPFTGALWTFNSLPYFPTYPGTIPYIMADNAPLVSDFDGDGALDVFFVMGYGTYTVNTNSIGKAFMIKGGVGTCPEWTMFRHDHNRTGYMSTLEVAMQCGLTTGLNESKKSITDVKVAPLPFTDKTEITCSSSKFKNSNLLIRDLHGKLVASYSSKEANVKEGELTWTWNSTGVPAGVYLFQITNGDDVLSGKMIKMD